MHPANGVVVVRRIPEHEAQSTGPELASQGRFTNATRYIKRLKANPDQYAPYQLAARIERKRACDLAMSDFLSAPVVNEVDLSGYSGKAGEVLRVQAADDFGVSFLGLTLSHLDGVLIESVRAKGFAAQERARRSLSLSRPRALEASILI